MQQVLSTSENKNFKSSEMAAIGSEKVDSFTIYCSITLVAAQLSWKQEKETILARAKTVGIWSLLQPHTFPQSIGNAQSVSINESISPWQNQSITPCLSQLRAIARCYMARYSSSTLVGHASNYACREVCCINLNTFDVANQANNFHSYV